MDEIQMVKKLFAEQKAEQEKSEAIYNSLFSSSSLGKMLKSWRLISGLTQKQLAEKLHTKRQHVQKWEYNICRPKITRLKEISILLAKKDITPKIIRRFYV